MSSSFDLTNSSLLSRCDLLFTLTTVGASFFSYNTFLSTIATDQKIPVRPLPIQFGWWGEVGNSIKDARAGAIIYPALVALMSGLNIYLKKSHGDRMQADPEKAARYRAAMTPRPNETVLPKLLRVLNRDFVLKFVTVFLLASQEIAHDISLGKRESMPANLMVRPLIGFFAALTLGHWWNDSDVLLE